MGIWKNFKKVLGLDTGSTNLAELTGTDALLAAILGGSALTREQALKIPAVSSNVDFLSNIMAVIPLKMYRRADGKITEVENDPRVRLFNDETGDTLDGFQMKKALTEDFLLGKGAYAYLNRNGNDLKSIHYVKENCITINKNTDPIFKDYRILCNGTTYWPFDFLRILRNTKDGASGVGLIDEVSKAFEIAYATLVYQLALIKSGGNKRGFLTSEKILSDAAIAKLKADWKNLYSNNETNAVVLNKGIEFKEASNTSIEMQLNQSKITLSAEIDRIFHIQSDFDMTFKTAILPIGTAFKTALNRDLLLNKEKLDGYYWDCDYNETTKASMKERFDAYKTAKDSGWITKNEIRRMENRESITGLDTVDVGLGAALYDTVTHTYYVPNTDTLTNTQKGGSNE